MGRKGFVCGPVHVILLLLLVAGLSGVHASWGSERLTRAGDYTIENWQVEQGLPQVSVTSLAQTADGYLWIGTFNGLARFDGVRFKVFDEGNTPALGNSAITHLQVDDEGTLWIVTLAGGVVRLTAGQFTMVLKENAHILLESPGLPDASGRRLLLLDRSGAWHQIERGQVLPLDWTKCFGTDDAPSFLFENASTGWVAQQGTIHRSHETAFPLSSSAESSREAVTVTNCSVGVSQAGGHWLAMTNGLYRLQQGTLSTRVALFPLRVGAPYMLQEDGQGTLWAGQWGTGLLGLGTQGVWRQLSGGDGLADNFVTCLFRDREGSLWVGTGQGGLHRIRPRTFRTYETAGGPNVVMSLFQDRQERMWFGVNGGGLHTLKDERLQPVDSPPVLRAYPLTYSLLADHSGGLWIGLYGMRLLHWKADTVTPYDVGEGPLKPMTPHVLFQDRAGTIWAGCTHSLLRYEEGRFKRYTVRDGLSSDTVVALAEDAAGVLYIGTDGGGLNSLSQGSFKCFSENDGLADNHLTSLYVDRDQTLWIGTANGGVSRFKDGRFASFGVKDGLPSNTLGSVIEDDMGQLWLGSNRGIIRLQRTALNAYLDGKLHPLPWQLFDRSDGLSAISTSSGGQPRSLKAKDGKMWFATVKGAAVIDPRRLLFNSIPPPVVIEEFVMDERVQILWGSGSVQATLNQVKSAGEKSRGSFLSGAGSFEPSPSGKSPTLEVPPRTHRVEFHFTGLSLVAPEKVSFRYRLDPYDAGWVQAGSRRIAYYTGIPPGRYQFCVTACNNDGVWNETGAALGLMVLPPWWMTWWFRTVALGGTIGVAAWIAEARVRRLKRQRTAQQAFSRRLLDAQEAERQRIAAELHDGLGQELLVIKNRAVIASRDPSTSASALEQFGEISQVASHALEGVREISYNLRPYQLDRLGLTKALQAMVVSISRASAMPIQTELDTINGLLEPSLEIHFYRIAQELLSNLVKHSHAATARVVAKCTPTGIALMVEDDGCGFDPKLMDQPSARHGLGLSDVLERVRLLGGSWRCDSRATAGTRWRIEVPVAVKKA